MCAFIHVCGVCVCMHARVLCVYIHPPVCRIPGEGGEEGRHPHAGHGRQPRRPSTSRNDRPGGQPQLSSLFLFLSATAPLSSLLVFLFFSNLPGTQHVGCLIKKTCNPTIIEDNIQL